MTHIEQVSAYVVWPIRHRVMYPDKEFEYIKLVNDDEGMHFALFEDNTLVSVASLFCNAHIIQFRKLATLNEFQGKGYGSRLLSHIIEFAQLQGAIKIWCNARRTAASFYAGFGFTETDNCFNQNGIDYVMMELYISSAELC